MGSLTYYRTQALEAPLMKEFRIKCENIRSTQAYLLSISVTGNGIHAGIYKL